ncbi:MAG: hypothetical protein IPM23_06580 [Candidatus Melainabacteria bacterium]|nr:hypothetical protein [Candidatus Melainabacteria bacterium]
MQPSLIFSRYTGWTFSSPEVAGIPTRLFYKDSQQGPVKVVETYHVRKIVGDKNMFQCPKGLKQVATEQLVVNQRPEEALEIMLGK